MTTTPNPEHASDVNTGPADAGSDGWSVTLHIPTYLIEVREHPTQPGQPERSWQSGQHLYLHHPMGWPDYKRLLGCLTKSGVIDRRWARTSIRSGQSVLPAPWLVNADRPDNAPTDLPHTHAEREIVRHRFMLRPDTRTDLRVRRPLHDTTLRYTRLPAKATHLSSLLTVRNNPPLHAPAIPLTIPATLDSTGDTNNDDGTVLTLGTLTPRQQRRLTKALTNAGLITPAAF